MAVYVQLLATTAGRNVAILVGALAVATSSASLLWPDGEQAIEAA